MLRRLRFGAFEIDLQNQELRKRGAKVKLQQKPFQILQRLLQSPGELVTRLELSQHLWPGLHVRFEGSLNTAVNALRTALDDPARCSRIIETRPGTGYRFVAPLKPSVKTGPGIPMREAENVGAQRDYLKGRYFCDKLTEEDLRKSVAYFEAALSEYPDFAPAHAGLADAYGLFAALGLMPAGEAHRRAKEFAGSAMRFDDQLAESHLSLAGVRRLFEWDWPGAEAAYRTALDLNPFSARGHQLYAAHLAGLGRQAEAALQIRLALEYDPASLVINMEAAWILYLARDFQGAIEQSWRTLAMEAKFAAAQNTLGLAYEQLGQYEEAIVELQNARVCSGDHPSAIAALGHAYATAGKQREALETLSELQQVAQSRFVSPYYLSMLHIGLGQLSLAYEWLEKALRERDSGVVWVKAEPRFDRLREDARFQELLRNMRLEP